MPPPALQLLPGNVWAPRPRCHCPQQGAAVPQSAGRAAPMPAGQRRTCETTVQSLACAWLHSADLVAAGCQNRRDVAKLPGPAGLSRWRAGRAWKAAGIACGPAGPVQAQAVMQRAPKACQTPPPPPPPSCVLGTSTAKLSWPAPMVAYYSPGSLLGLCARAAGAGWHSQACEQTATASSAGDQARRAKCDVDGAAAGCCSRKPALRAAGRCPTPSRHPNGPVTLQLRCQGSWRLRLTATITVSEGYAIATRGAWRCALGIAVGETVEQRRQLQQLARGCRQPIGRAWPSGCEGGRCPERLRGVLTTGCTQRRQGKRFERWACWPCQCVPGGCLAANPSKPQQPS